MVCFLFCLQVVKQLKMYYKEDVKGSFFIFKLKIRLTQ